MLGRMTQPGQPVFGLEHSNEGLITFPGGVDLRFMNYFFEFQTKTTFFRNNKGEFIGSIGVSGGTVEEDLEIARAAAEAVRNMQRIVFPENNK